MAEAARKERKNSLPLLIGLGGAAVLGAVVLGKSGSTPPTPAPPNQVPGAPDVNTTVATNLTISGATLNGTIDAGNEALTDCHFDLGLDSGYGTQIACT